MSPKFNITVYDHGDRFQVLFSYETVHYYVKRDGFSGLVTKTSYRVNDGQDYSPPADSLVVSTYDGLQDLAITNYHATSEVRPPNAQDFQDKDRSQDPATAKPNIRHGLGLTALPGQKKKDKLGFEYAEHSYLGDAISLTLADGTTVTAEDHLFGLENGLNVTYGEINGLAGDFYGTDKPISDGSTDDDKRARFLDAYKTLAAPSTLQPTEAKDILKVLKKEVDAINEVLHNHEDPSLAYMKLPDETYTFI